MVNTNKKVLENLIDLLVYNDIDTFFLVTGGAIVPTVDYLGQQKNVKYYCFQHEQSAAMAAEGYYRTTGKMAAVLTTSGPGAQNLLNGVCGCWYESIPAIFITGQVSTYESLDSINSAPRQVGFQETPIVDAFKPFTKYIVKVQSAETFDFHIKSAIKSAVSGRMGPVLLDLPVDIQNKVIPEFSLERIQKENIVYDLSTDINTLNSKLAQSSKPLLLLGHGIRLSNAVDVVRTLIDKLQIPFVVSWSAFDLIEHSHPLYVGDIGVYGNRGANFVVQNCDLLISIGSRLDTRQTGGDVKTFSPDSYKVMVDIDDNEIYKNRGLTVDLPIVSDAREFIESWLPTIQNDSNNRNEWVSYVNKCKTAEFNKRNLNPDVLSSYEFLEHLNNKIPTNAIIIPDEGGNLVF
jgi:acetolactate synthase-1/2/3 large subunit